MVKTGVVSFVMGFIASAAVLYGLALALTVLAEVVKFQSFCNFLQGKARSLAHSHLPLSLGRKIGHVQVTLTREPLLGDLSDHRRS